MACESYMNAAFKCNIVHIVISSSTYQGNQAQDPVELNIYINTDKYFVPDTSSVRSHTAENCSSWLLGVRLCAGIQRFGRQRI